VYCLLGESSGSSREGASALPAVQLGVVWTNELKPHDPAVPEL